MSLSSPPDAYCIGWDVGGWNCDKNPNSRDALCILNEQRDIVGRPWRGNLRQSINQAADTVAWLARVFALCGVPMPRRPYRVTLAIDTPLGFPQALIDLLTRGQVVGAIGHSKSNPYLFRSTERRLYEQGVQPLSAIKDMIGSQATKGIHALARFAPQRLRCGVWTDGAMLTAIEAYPAPCKRSALIQSMKQRYSPLDHDDKSDALTCALLAFLFDQNPAQLAGPDADVPESEGWIWLPTDCLGAHESERLI
jgi:hypothetical protein